MDFTTVNRLDTSTLYKLEAKAIDNITKFSPLLWAILGKQKNWRGTAGKFPIQYQQTDNGTFFTGMEQFNTNLVSDFVNLTFSPVGVEEPIVVSGIEQSINATLPTVSLLRRSMERSANAMITKLGKAFYTLQSGKAPNSILDISDDGSNVATFGGLSRTTYPAIQGHLTTGLGALTTSAMGTMYDSCSNGPNHPDLIICDKTTWKYYEALVPARQIVNSIKDMRGYSKWTINGVQEAGSLHSGVGFDSLDFRGTPIVADELAPAGTMFFLNTNYINWYGLPPVSEGYTPFKFVDGAIEDVYDKAPKTFGWGFSGMHQAYNQFGSAGHILLLGNLVGIPDFNGRIEGITS